MAEGNEDLLREYVREVPAIRRFRFGDFEDDELADEYFDPSDDEEDHLLREGEVVEDGPLQYIRIQENIYKNFFDYECLTESDDFQSFLRMLPRQTPRDVFFSDMKYFHEKGGLSRSSGQELIDIMGKYAAEEVRVPQSWRTIMRHFEKKYSFVNDRTLREVVPFPESFRMDLFDEPGHPVPAPIELIARDPLELIALKLVDPTLMYLRRDDIQFNYVRQTLEDGTHCITDLMTSEWARNTELEVRELNPNGILIPMITYADGVHMGLRNNVSE